MEFKDDHLIILSNVSSSHRIGSLEELIQKCGAVVGQLLPSDAPEIPVELCVDLTNAICGHLEYSPDIAISALVTEMKWQSHPALVFVAAEYLEYLPGVEGYNFLVVLMHRHDPLPLIRQALSHTVIGDAVTTSILTDALLYAALTKNRQVFRYLAKMLTNREDRANLARQLTSKNMDAYARMIEPRITTAHVKRVNASSPFHHKRIYELRELNHREVYNHLCSFTFPRAHTSLCTIAE